MTMNKTRLALMITTTLLAGTALAQLPGNDLHSDGPLTLQVERGDHADFITATAITRTVVTKSNPGVSISAQGNHFTFQIKRNAPLTPSCASFYEADSVTSVCIVPVAAKTN